jgi:hypothetical protein
MSVLIQLHRMNIFQISELTDPIVDITSVTSIQVPTKGVCNIRRFEIMINRTVQDIVRIVKEHQFTTCCLSYSHQSKKHDSMT